MIRVLLAHRTAEPVPVFWLGATALGVLFGIALRTTLGWPILLVVAAWLLLVWLIFLASVLLPLGRDDLWVDLVRTVSPVRARRLEKEQLIRLARVAPGPVYGLASLTGGRSLGGSGRDSPVGLTHLELIYGNPSDGPYLRVKTMWKGPGLHDAEPDLLRQELTRELWHRQTRPPDDLAPEQHHQWVLRRRVDIDRRPVPSWDRSELLIDGVARRADVFAEGDQWVALIDVDNAVVGLQSYGVPVDLIVVTQIEDLTPYVEGSQRSL